jgi:hypothetical protein
MKHYHHTIEARLKMSIAHKGRTLTKEHRDKVIKTLRYGQKGETNPNWKGGRTLNTEGYIWIKNLEHPYKNALGYVAEHRLVMEDKLGRYLLPSEVIHHLNGNRTDNRIENLRLVTAIEHADIHWKNPEARKRQSLFMTEVRKNKYWSTRKKL